MQSNSPHQCRILPHAAPATVASSGADKKLAPITRKHDAFTGSAFFLRAFFPVRVAGVLAHHVAKATPKIQRSNLIPNRSPGERLS